MVTSERQRLSALHAYDILDTPPEASFDRITALAATLFGVPTVLVSLIDETRQWFKSCYGFSVRETGRDLSFCQHAILSDEVMVVEDARNDPRFKDNPLVTGEPHIRFYAGAPLVTPAGQALGTLCLIDYEPRNVSAEERSRLATMAQLVVEALEFRMAASKLTRAEAQGHAEREARAKLDRLVAQMVASTDLAIVSVDTAGLIRSWNTAAEALYGYREDEVIGQHVDLLTPPGHEDFATSMRYLERGESVRKLELVRQHKNGESLDVSLSVSPILDGGGAMIGASFIAADISRRRRSERERDRLFVLSADLFCIADFSGRLRQINPAWEATLGYAVDDLLGQSALDFVHPDDREATAREGKRLVEGQNTVHFENRYRCKDGGYRWLLWNATVYAEEDLIYAVARDISERKREQETLKRYSGQLGTILRSITDAFFSLDTAWRFTYLNPQAEALLQRRQDELLGVEIYRAFPQGVSTRFDMAFKETMKTGQPSIFEEFYASLGLWLEVHAYPSSEGLSVYFQDITGRKVAEQALKEADDFKDKVMQSVSEAIVALDRSGCITLANRRLYELVGQDAESLQGSSFFALFEDASRSTLENGFGRAVAGSAVTGLELELRGERHSVLNVNVSPLETAGAISGAVVTAEDITLAKDATDRLRLLENAVENIDEVVLITDTELSYPGPKIIYVNHAFEKITGYRPDEVVGKTPRLLQGPKTDRTVLARLRRSLEREEPFTARAINYRKDGSDYVIEWHISAVRDEEGRLTHWAAVQRDISQRTEYEAKILELNNTLKQRLRELDAKNEELRKIARLAEVRKENFEQAAGELANTARQLHTIFALSPDGFASVDESGTVAYVNDAFLRMTGLRPEQLIGQPETVIDRLLYELCEPALPYSSCLVDSETFQDAIHLVRPRPTIVQRIVRTLLSEATERLGRVLYLRDITHESEVDRLKSEFLSTTAHELRTPMTSIYGFSQLLLERDYDLATSKELIKTIHDQSARLVQLLNELLDLARIEARAGKDFRISPQDLAPIIHETLRAFKVEAKHELTLELPKTLPKVAVDADKMQQVLTNVLSNALKYSPNGGVIRLRAACVRRGGRSWLSLCVEDQGIGMTRDQLARIFERFYRADSSGTIPGTGLGMSLVKEIVELHGGSVEVSSERGQGTAVTLWLPVEPG